MFSWLPAGKTLSWKNPGLAMFPAGLYWPTTKTVFPSVAKPTPTSLVDFQTTWVKCPTNDSESDSFDVFINYELKMDYLQIHCIDFNFLLIFFVQQWIHSSVISTIIFTCVGQKSRFTEIIVFNLAVPAVHRLLS